MPPSRQALLAEMRGRLESLIKNPGPLVANGGIVVNPATGQPFANEPLRLEAIKLLLRLLEEERRPSVASASLEDIEAAVERMRQEVREAEEDLRKAQEES